MTIELLQRRVMTGKLDTPLVRFASQDPSTDELVPSPEALEHMFKQRDRNNVYRVVNCLHRCGMAAYLGGSVVQDWVRTGRRDYNDIDILGFHPDESTVVDVIRSLNNSPMNPLKDSFELKCIPEGVRYLQGPISGRFTLTPIQNPLGKMLRKQSPIDLSLTAEPLEA